MLIAGGFVLVWLAWLLVGLGFGVALMQMDASPDQWSEIIPYVLVWAGVVALGAGVVAVVVGVAVSIWGLVKRLRARCYSALESK